MFRKTRPALLALSFLLAACSGVSQASSAGREDRAPLPAPTPAFDRHAAICANPQDASENREYCLGNERPPTGDAWGATLTQ